MATPPFLHHPPLFFPGLSPVSSKKFQSSHPPPSDSFFGRLSPPLPPALFNKGGIPTLYMFSYPHYCMFFVPTIMFFLSPQLYIFLPPLLCFFVAIIIFFCPRYCFFVSTIVFLSPLLCFHNSGTLILKAFYKRYKIWAIYFFFAFMER